MNFPPGLRKRRTHRRLLIAGVLAVCCLFLISLVAQSQGGQDRTSQLKGKTRKVTPVPNGTTDAGAVVFKQDSDNDGMSDEDEANNGTDPNDPSDADADADGDGLSNGDEVAMGANPNAADTDGDGVSDIDEVRLGYDPTDANNTPPAGGTLASLVVSPTSINLSINSLLGQQPVQLRVTGVLSDGTTVDLTRGPTLTYQSLDSSVAVVDDFGTVVGMDAGATTIRVISGAVLAEVPVVVTILTPGALSQINIPGYANNVDVAGDFAYVAAGSAGLVVVNVNDRSNPLVVATLNTPGNANDVRVVGTRAYVADGSSGLQIIDISTPANPSVLGSLDTPGDASDVVVYGTRAYVADGFAGLRIMDVSNPSAPTTLGFVATAGAATGVDVSGDWVVVANGQTVRIIDAAIPTSPTIVGSVALPSANALDLEVRNRFAYVATFGRGLQVIDFSIPTGPRAIAGVDIFNLNDVALANQFAVGAEMVFPNFIPIFDLGDPGNPSYLAALNPSSTGNIRGTGLAVTGQHIYMTGTIGSGANNGSTGNTRLFILEYQAAAPEVSDTAGIAPMVTVDSPQTGQSTTEGDRLPISITATDDVKVASVQLIVNGVVIIEDGAAPYNITYAVPHGVTSLVIEAKAFDVAGNAATSPPVTVNVLPDPPPTIAFITPAEGQILWQHQTIFIAADANDNREVAQVVFSINGTTLPNFSFYTVPSFATSLTFVATATDDFGQTASTTRIVSVLPDPPPTLTIVSPADGTQLTEGQVVEFIADASDNISVDSVEFTINGEVFTDFQDPYRQTYTIPAGITSLLVEVAALDNLDQRTIASRVFTVVPDPGTTVTGRVLDTSAQPVVGATAKVGQLTAQTGADGRFSIPEVPTAQPEVLVRVTATIGGQSAANASLPTARVPGGTTDVGVVTLSILPTAPTAFAVTDYNADFVPDVFVGYPDRQSLIYSLTGDQFSANANLLLPYGAVSSGANLDLNSGSQHQMFAQLAGRPGSVTEATFDDGTMFAPRTLATGLGGESEYTAVGLDKPQQSSSDFKASGEGSARTGNPLATVGSNLSVLAFLKNGSGATSLTVRFGNDSAEGFADPLALQVDPAVPLRTLTVADINNDGLVDVMIVKPDTGSGAKLVVYRRTSASTFGSPVESPITVRLTVPARGAVDFVLGSLVGNSNKDIAVLGDDRVRIYRGDGTGAFVSTGEIILPAGRIATGLTAFDVSDDGVSDLIVTFRNPTAPTSKEARLYLNTFSGAFQTPTITTYVAPISAGDTRIGVGDWGGNFRSLDMVVVDGEAVRILFDIGPVSSGS